VVNNGTLVIKRSYTWPTRPADFIFIGTITLAPPVCLWGVEHLQPKKAKTAAGGLKTAAVLF
jgi:hypothetical protein